MAINGIPVNEIYFAAFSNKTNMAVLGYIQLDSDIFIFREIEIIKIDLDN